MLFSKKGSVSLKLITKLNINNFIRHVIFLGYSVKTLVRYELGVPFVKLFYYFYTLLFIMNNVLFKYFN